MDEFCENHTIKYKQDWNYIINGNKTFYAVLHDYWSEISKHWNEDTQKTYLQDYNLCILPDLNDKALSDCTRDDIDAILDGVCAKKKAADLAYSEETRRHIRHLVKCVLKIAIKENICPDILWGTEYSVSEKKEDEDLCKDEYVKLRKSLTVQEELDVKNRILTNPQQDGEYFGLALMFCLGLRNNEACGADFHDIRPFDCDSSYYALWVYKSTERGTNVQRYGGKTSNVSRVIPIPSVLLKLLQQRRKYLCTLASQEIENRSIQTEKSPSEYVDDLPIAGTGPHHDIRCSAPGLTKAGTLLLKEIKLSQELLSLIDRDIRKPGRTEEGIAEKDPTVYLFRRNLGTHLYLLGLDDSEIQYILGHEIEDEDDERSFFRNEEKLYPIAQKMALRPIVNSITGIAEATLDSPGWNHHDVSHIKLHLPTQQSSHHKVIIQQREPFSSLSVSIKDSSDNAIDGVCIISPGDQAHSDTLSITSDYHSYYKKHLAKAEKTIP